MIGSSTSTLPILVLFERHWDRTPKNVLQSLFPKLSELGYDTLCIEAPQNFSEKEIVSSHRNSLESDQQLNSEVNNCLKRVGIIHPSLFDIGYIKLAELMRNFVSTQHYSQITEKVKGLPASILFKNILQTAVKLHFTIKGVDINSKEYGEMISLDLSKRMEMINFNEELRILTFYKNLLALHEKGKNIIFVCGAFHAKNLINKFTDHKIQDRVYYSFPYSNKSYSEGFDDVKESLLSDTLVDHSFCITNSQEKKTLQDKIVKDIKAHNISYLEEVIGGNSHSQFLSDFFNLNFKAYLRSGFYCDAILDVSEVIDLKILVEKLQQVSIDAHSITFEGKKYLVIQNINTKEIADKIRQLC